MVKESYDVIVNRSGVDEISDKISLWGKKSKINKRDLIRIRFSVEEALLSICEKYEESKEVTVKFISRLDSYSIQIEYEGEAYNPRSGSDDDADEWTNQILGKMGQKAEYQRKNNINTLRFFVSRKIFKTELFMIIALVMAVIFGVFGKFIPDVVRENIAKYGLDFISNIFMHLLGMFSGLMIFLILVNGICGMGSVADFSKVGRVIIGRYVGLSFLGSALLIFIAQFFFNLSWGGSVNGASIPEQIEGILLDILPDNPIGPFLEGNMLQIIFMAIFLGAVLLILGDRARSFRNFFAQGSDVVTKAVDCICIFLPLFIFTSLLSLFWEVGFSSLVTCWKPIAVAVFIVFVVPVIKLTYVFIRYHISPFLMIRRLSKSFLVLITTASGMASFSAIKEDLVKRLGVDEKFVGLSYPIGMSMYATNYMLVYALIVLYLAERNSTPVSIIWLAMAGFLSVVFSMATPNVTGAALICIGVIMTNLNMPKNGLALAGTLAVILDFYITAFQHFIQEIEVYIQARMFDKVDLSVLESNKIQTQ